MGLSNELPGAKRKVRGILNSHLEQINQWLTEGYTKKQVFEYLKNESVIDCKYNHFVTTINKLMTQKKKIIETIPKRDISGGLPKKKGFEMMRLDKDEFK